MNDEEGVGGWLTFGFHLFHRWSKWHDAKEGTITRSETDKLIGFWTVQERRCLTCGRIERRTSKVRL